MDKGVTVLIQCRAQPNQVAMAKRELIFIIAKIVATEPDCLGIQLHQDLDDETRFFLYQRWTCREAYTRPHLQTPHVQAFIKRTPAFMDGLPSVTFWEVVDEHTRD